MLNKCLSNKIISIKHPYNILIISKVNRFISLIFDLGKEEVMGSNPINSSKVAVNKLAAFLFYYTIIQIVTLNKSLSYRTL